MKRLTSLSIALALATTLTVPAEAKPKKDGGGKGGGRAPSAAVAKPKNIRVAAPRAPRASAPRASQRVAFQQRPVSAKPKANVAAQRSAAIRNNMAAQQRLSAQRQAASQRAAVVQQNTARARAVAAQRSSAATRSYAVRQREIGAQLERNRIAAVAEQRRDRDRDDDRRGDRWDRSDRERYYRAPFSVHRHWDRGRVHYWNSRPYHWYGGSWVLFDSYRPYDTSTTVVYTPSSSYSASVVDDVQSALVDAGYNPGPIDGVMGSATRSAIADYQADHGLAVTGRIDDTLLRSLGI